MSQEERKERFIFDVPWEKLAADSRAIAVEFAADIVFCDRSAVRWNGLNFEPNFGYLREPSRETEADRFLEERFKIAKRAAGLPTD